MPDAERCLTQTDLSAASRRQQLRPNHPDQHPVTLRVLFQAGHAPGLEGEQQGGQPPEVGDNGIHIFLEKQFLSNARNTLIFCLYF